MIDLIFNYFIKSIIICYLMIDLILYYYLLFNDRFDS